MTKILRTNTISVSSLPLNFVARLCFFLLLSPERDFSRYSKVIQSKLMFTVIFHGEAQKTGTLLLVDGIRLVKKESLHTERERDAFDIKKEQGKMLMSNKILRLFA